MNKQELIEEIKDLKHHVQNKSWIDRELVLDLVEQLDEPKEAAVPQFVADWYEERKDDLETALFRCVDIIPRVYEDGELNQFQEWFISGETKPFQTLVNMHQFGYEVEKEKRYTVKMRTTNQPLFYNSLEKRLFFSLGKLATQFTFKQLEEAGFREAFNSPLFEVEEVVE